jgi:hypothetical protein
MTMMLVKPVLAGFAQGLALEGEPSRIGVQ